MDETKALPLISIIVPVYNVKDYVEKCLDSICGQSYTNLEIIVVDDGSTDGSGKICDAYASKDRRIKVIHRKNGGLSAARNEGLDAATGEFLGFVDSDDWIDLDMFKFLYELLETEEADISICSHYIERSGRTKIKYSSDKVLNLVPCDAMRLLVEDDIIRNFAWDKLYRRTLFYELRFPQGRYFEDIAVMYKVFYQARKIVMKGCPKYHYMVRTNSITGSKYNPEKEYHMFLAVYEQCTFIQEKELWDKAPVFIIRSGVHLMDHIMLVPSSPFVEEIVRDVLNKMHQYDDISFRQIGMAIAVKRWAIYHNLSRYRSVYRFVRSVFKSKSHRF